LRLSRGDSVLIPTFPPAPMPGVQSRDCSLARVAGLSRAYTYCVSRAGITGAHAEGQFDGALIERLAEAGAPPPVFGFGISRPEHVRAALEAGAAGVICGSAIVDCAANGGDVAALVTALKSATRNDSAPQ
jgi:tryptophan synthase alpha chain